MCNDDSGPSAPNEPETVMYDDYVLFDTTRFMIQRSPEVWPDWEWYVQCEASLGEPFIGLNNNGVYDLGIDLFVKAVGPENMDLNDNGQHDGPDDPWEPGIPFDDINGDGERFCISEQVYDPRYYQDWMPYCDMNGNGQWDSALSVGYKVARWGTSPGIHSGLRYRPVTDDSAFWHVTDAGVQYWYPEGPEHSQANIHLNLLVDDTGLSVFPSNNHVRVLEFGENRVEATRVPFTTSLCVVASLRRTLKTNETLEIFGTTYRDLLLVRLDDPRDSLGEVSDCQIMYWEYYFARNVGLIAFRLKWGGNPEKWFYYDQQFDGPRAMMNPALGCQPARSEDHAGAK